jgi:hypothetical protein
MNIHVLKTQTTNDLIITIELLDYNIENTITSEDTLTSWQNARDAIANELMLRPADLLALVLS